MGGLLSLFSSHSEKTKRFLLIELIFIPHLFDKVLEKFAFHDYVLLQRTSKIIYETCVKTKSGPILRADRIDVGAILDSMEVVIKRNGSTYSDLIQSSPRIHTAYLSFDLASIDRLQFVSKNFEKNKTTAEIVHIKFLIGIESDEVEDELEKLCQIVQSKEILLNKALHVPFSILHKKLFKSYAFRGSVKLYDIGVPVPFVRNDLNTLMKINELIQEWYKEERKLLDVTISIPLVNCTSNESISTILEGVPANPIWTVSHHNDSLIDRAKLGSNALQNLSPCYSLWRAHKINEVLLITIQSKAIIFKEVHLTEREKSKYCWEIGESKLLFSQLSKTNYYQLIGRHRQ